MRELENYGLVELGGKTVATYSIVAHQDHVNIDNDKNFYANIAMVGDHFNFQGFTVASHGLDNNLPIEVKNYTRNNAILPEILKKQVRMMYGHGYGLYTVDFEKDPTKRIWVDNKYPLVLAWLDSWDKDPELDPIQVYLKLVIQEYYTLEGYWNRWMMNKARRINGAYGLPVRGLKYLNGAKCRLAKYGILELHKNIKDEDCDSVMVTDWTLRNQLDVDVWPRFDRSNPFKFESAVNYIRDRGFDEDIYANPTFYFGLKEWLKGSNLSPKYINSYLKNSLSAKIHVKIPHAWIDYIEETLKRVCNDNHQRQVDGKKLITEFEGVEIGTEFSYEIIRQVINKKIVEATTVLSGSGENQGKTFWSRTFLTEHGLEGWEFVEIPSKYKEFVDSLLKFNMDSLKMILAGKGVDPAISNIGNEGVYNSGAQVYYSYLVYLDTLGFAEEFILEDLNRALWINFPELQKARVKIGLKRFAPPRQQETAPNDRLDSNNQNKAA